MSKIEHADDCPWGRTRLTLQRTCTCSAADADEGWKPNFRPDAEMFVCMDPTGCYHVSWNEEQHRAKMAQVGATDEARYVRSPQPAGVRVAVKPLVWEEDEIGWWCAQPPAMIGGFGYEVRVTDSGKVRSRRGREDWTAFEGTLSEAKAAAEADYRQRILSAIEPQQEEAQCCMCGKKGLSTVEGDGGTECQLEDGRWTCSQDCYYTAVDWFSHPTPVQKVQESQTVSVPNRKWADREPLYEAAIAAYEAATPPDYRYSAIALVKAVDAALAAIIQPMPSTPLGRIE